jgi:DNA-binding PadR family transcriptional regulator
MDDAHMVAELERLKALFRVDRAALALLCLATGGPMRWTDVRRILSQLTGEPITDKATTRALHALEELELVVDGEDGNLYALTALGTYTARQVRDLLDGLNRQRSRDRPESEPPRERPGAAQPG